MRFLVLVTIVLFALTACQQSNTSQDQSEAKSGETADETKQPTEADQPVPEGDEADAAENQISEETVNQAQQQLGEILREDLSERQQELFDKSVEASKELTEEFQDFLTKTVEEQKALILKKLNEDYNLNATLEELDEMNQVVQATFQKNSERVNDVLSQIDQQVQAAENELEKTSEKIEELEPVIEESIEDVEKTLEEIVPTPEPDNN